MKRYFLISFISFLTLINIAASNDKLLTAKFCNIMKNAFSGTYNPKDLCEKYHGTFCSNMKSIGQGICAANGKPFCDSYKNDGHAICEAGEGVFCSSIKTMAGGICASLGKPFCDKEIDEVKWKSMLREACYWE